MPVFLAARVLCLLWALHDMLSISLVALRQLISTCMGGLLGVQAPCQRMQEPGATAQLPICATICCLLKLCKALLAHWNCSARMRRCMGALRGANTQFFVEEMRACAVLP